MVVKTSKQLQDPQLSKGQLLLTKLLLEQAAQVEPKGQLLKGRIPKRFAGCAIPLNMWSNLECAVVAVK